MKIVRDEMGWVYIEYENCHHYVVFAKDGVTGSSST